MSEDENIANRLKEIVNLLDLSPNPIIEVDLAGHIYYLNPVAKRIFPDLEKRQLNHPFLSGLESALILKSDNKFPLVRQIEVNGRQYTQTICYTLTRQRIYIYGSDITEAGHAEKELKASEEKFRKLFESSNDAVFLADVDTGIIINANQKAQELLSMSFEDIVGLKYTQIYPQGKSKHYEELFKDAIAKGGVKVISEDILLCRKDGHEIPTSVSTSVIEVGGRRIIQGIFKDIAERKIVEEELQLSKFAIEHNSVSAFWVGFDGKFLYVNEAGCKSLGYSREELLSMGVYDIDPNYSSRDIWLNHWEEIRRRGHFTFESMHRAKDGRTYPVEITVNYLKINDKEYNFAFAQDITVRKKMENELRKNEEIYRLFLENFQGIAYRRNMDFTPFFFYGAVEKITGYSCEELLSGKPLWNQLIYLEDVVFVYESNNKIQETTNYSCEREYRIIRKDGQIRWIHELIQNVCDSSGKPVYIQGSLYDVTDRKQTEEALRESEEKYRRIIETAQEGILVIDAENKAVFVNKKIADMFGYGVQEMMHKSFFEFMDGEWHIVAERDFLRRKDSLKGQFDFKFLRRDGSDLWVIINASPILSRNGEYLGVLLMITDITSRKKMENALYRVREDLEVRIQRRTSELAAVNVALQEEIAGRQEIEKALKEAEIKYRTLIEQIPAVTYIAALDEKNTKLYISPQIKNILGISADEFISDPDLWQKNIYQEDRQRVSAELSFNQKTHQPLTLEYRIVSREGNIIWFLDEASVIKDESGKTLFLQGIMLDISKRKKTEELLRENEERYRRILGRITDYIYSVNIKKGRVIETIHGPACQLVTGYTADEFLSDPNLWIKMVYNEDRNLVMEWAARILSGEKAEPLEHRIVRKDNAIRWIRNIPVFHYDNTGKVVSYDGVIEDITDRKEVEEERLRAEALAAIIEGMPDAVIVIDAEKKIIKFNKALADNFGFRNEVLGRNFSEFCVKKDFSKIASGIEECLKEGYLRNLEVNIFSKDRKEIPVLLNISLLRNTDNKVDGMIATITNISERKRLEELKDRFINNVSHELRTPLQAIREGVSVVGEGLTGEVSSKQREILGIIKKDIERLTGLINNVLDYQKFDYEGFKLDITKEDVNELIEEVKKSTAALALKKGLNLSTSLEKDLPRIYFDRAKITQVLLNLLTNAIKFTDHGDIKIVTTRSKDEIFVCVEDTGIGIKEEDIHKLFDAFSQITRKDKKKKDEGTGLGLLISKKIIQRHGGKVWVESKYGSGSKFYFAIPIGQ